MGKQPSWSRRRTKYEKFRSRVRRFENLEGRTLLAGNGFFAADLVTPIVGQFVGGPFVHPVSVLSVTGDTDVAATPSINEANDGIVATRNLSLRVKVVPPDGSDSTDHNGLKMFAIAADGVTELGQADIPEPNNQPFVEFDLPVVLVDSQLRQTFTLKVSRPGFGVINVTGLTGDFTLDTIPPDVPGTPDLQPGSDTGSSNIDNITADPTPTFDISSVNAGNTLQLLRDGQVVVSTVAATSGTVALTDDNPGPTTGPHVYTARQIDLAGNTSVSSGAGLTVTINTAVVPPPNAPTLQGDFTRPNKTPLTFTITGVNAGNTADLLRDGISIDSVAPYNDSGLLPDGSKLPTGTHSYTATQSSPTGNSLPGAATTVAIDNTAPTITSISVVDPIPSSLGGLVTDKFNPTFEFKITDDRFVSVDNTLTVKLVKSGSTLFSTTSQIARGADGRKQVTVQGAPSGTFVPGLNTISLQVTDGAGNVTTTPVTFFIQQTGTPTPGAPGTPVYTSQYELNTAYPDVALNIWTEAFDNTTQTFWFTMERGKKVGQFDPATGKLNVWELDSLGQSADNPHGIAFDFNTHLTPRVWFVHRNAGGANAPPAAPPAPGRLSYFDMATNELVSYDFPSGVDDPITNEHYDLTDLHAVTVDSRGTVWVTSDQGDLILEFDFDEPIAGGTNLNSRVARLVVHSPPESHEFEHFHPHGLEVVVDDRTGQPYVWAISKGGSGQYQLLLPGAGENGRDLWMTWESPIHDEADGTFIKIDDNETPGNPLDDKIIASFPSKPGSAGGNGQNDSAGLISVLDPSAQLADLSSPHAVTFDAWQIYGLPSAPPAQSGSGSGTGSGSGSGSGSGGGTGQAAGTGLDGTILPLAAINQPFVDRSGEIYYIDRLGSIARFRASELPASLKVVPPDHLDLTTIIDRAGTSSAPILVNNPFVVPAVKVPKTALPVAPNDSQSDGKVVDRSNTPGLDQYENALAQSNGKGAGPFRGFLNAGGVLYGSMTQNDTLSTTVFAETERRPMAALASPTALAAGVVQGRMAFQVKRDGSLILTARGDGELADNQTNLSDVIAGKSGSLSRSALSIDGDPSAVIDNAGNVFVFGRNNTKGLVVYKYTASAGQWTSAKLFNPANWSAFTLTGLGGTTLPSDPSAYIDANGRARALVTNHQGHLLLFSAESASGVVDLTSKTADPNANLVYSSVGVVRQGNMMYAYGTNQTGGLIEYSFKADVAQLTAATGRVVDLGSTKVPVFQDVAALVVNGNREIFAIDGNAQLVNIRITGAAGTGPVAGTALNVTQSIITNNKAFGYFDWQKPYGGRVYTDLAPVVYGGKLYVYGTNGSDLIEFTRDAQGKWQAANLTNDVYATLGADASPTRNPSSRSPANKVFGAPTAYVQTNGERHILQINADGDVVEYYYLPGDAIAHAHTQNVNLRLQNATSFSVNENATLDVAKPGVLQNFVPAGSAALQASWISGPQHGTLTLRTDGSFTYVPNPGFSGRDGFVFKAVGSLTAADPIEVSITVLPLVASTSLSPSDQVFLAAASKQMLGHALDGLNDGILTQFAVAGASRAQLADQFWLLAENRANRVSLLYQQILHRAADKSGRDYFSQHTASNPFSENAVARALLKSSEYQQTRTSNATFVDGLYRDVLGRAPDTGGLNSWTQALNQGTSRDAVIDGFLNSSERRSRVIKDLTTQIFGVSTTVNALPTSSDPSVLGKAILASPEFARSAPLVPLTPEQRTYLDRLTKSLAGRAPAASELDLLANDLRLDSTRLSFVKDVWYFNENLVKRVDAVYRLVLKRSPNSTESSTSVNSLRNGGTEDDLAVTLLTSAEYTNANSSTSAFVDSLYKNILGRNADTAGKNSWVAALAGGQSRASVARSFLNSDERRLKVIDSLYTSLLGKTADATGRSFYLDKFKSGLTVEGVNQLFLASNDYFTKLIK